MSFGVFSRVLLALSIAASGLSGCSSKEGAEGKAKTPGSSSGSTTPAVPTTQIFARDVTRVEIEIDYAPGAEPFTGMAGQFSDVWKLFRTNALAVFDGKKEVVFPTKVRDMEQLPDVTASGFSNADLLAVAEAHRGLPPEADGQASFYVLFVNGYFVDDSNAVRKDKLATSFPGTGIIVVFKQAILETTTTKNGAAALLEQTALLHEFGHAVGFVNNGVPLAPSNPHHDEANGPHCTNAQCIMNVGIEDGARAAVYARKYIFTGDPVLYGQECLSDARVLENQALGR